MGVGIALVWASVAALAEAGELWLPEPRPDDPLCTWLERVAHAPYTGDEELVLSLAALKTLATGECPAGDDGDDGDDDHTSGGRDFG